jgi:predicted metal-dependent phosphoesterase TrpH
VIAICDHNSTRNVAAVRHAGRREALAVLGGVEVASEEEVHILALFDDQESLQKMQQVIDDNFGGENNPELFGEQNLYDEHDSIVGRESRLLIGATRLSVEKVVESIHSFAGLAIASHVDRESFSLLSQLGMVPEGLDIDALEVSRRSTVTEATRRIPQIGDYPVVRSSDAHRLEDIGAAVTTFTAAEPTVSELRKALLGRDARHVVV